MALPTGYKQYEYVQSNGGAYIDTGFTPNQNTRIDIVAVPLSVAESAAGVGMILYGAGAAYNSQAFECYTASNQYEFNYGTSYKFIGAPAIGQKLSISHNKNSVSVTVDGGTPLTMTLTSNTFTCPRSLTLFAINRATPLIGQCRIYSCKIYDNGTLVRDLVPCRKTTGTAANGMYDTVNSKFYSSETSTELTTGQYEASVSVGDVFDFPYDGNGSQGLSLPAGIYKLECWGAQGGNYSTNHQGGHGGYSVGTLKLTTTTQLYIWAGGQGSSSSTAGGFNGGGSGNGTGRGGGGASDIRIGSDSLYARVIVAGAGGGSGISGTNKGGAGGGLIGYDGANTANRIGSSYSGGGATQTEAGIGYNSSSATVGGFGQGGNGTYNSYAGGGGSGWYGGGGAYRSNTQSSYGRSGGGGSGYVYTKNTTDSIPTDYLLTDKYYLTEASTIDGLTVFKSPVNVDETGHTGDGYIRITVIKAIYFNLAIKVNNEWKTTTDAYVNINGEWKSLIKAYGNVDGVWKENIAQVTPSSS